MLQASQPINSLYLEDMKILEAASILSFLLFLFFFAVDSKNHCLTSSCENSSFPITYPFKLSGQQLQNCEYISLKCHSKGLAILDLPHLGEFYVENINYETQKIRLYDPSNCLPRRLLNFSLQSSPLKAIEYQNYTFYSCPPEKLRGSAFKIIGCLSNSTSSTVATSFAPRGMMEKMYKCKAMFTSTIPVSCVGQLDNWGTDTYLQLSWEDLICKDCEDKRSKLSKIIAVLLSIPGIIIVSAICCVASVMQLFSMVKGKYEHFVAVRGVAAPQATTNPDIAPSSMPSQTISTVGLDDSKIKFCTELVALDEDQRISTVSESNSCPICLDGYHLKDTVRCISVCEHHFHADCIEQWLRKNGTCPVCRTSALSEQC